MAARPLRLTILLSLFLAWPTTVHGAQILGLFSHPGQSHFDFFRPLFLGLAEKGHNITMISYFPNKTPVENYTDYVLSGTPILTNYVDLKTVNNRSQIIPYKIPMFFMLGEWGMQACEAAFNSPIIKDLLQSPMQYDVIILEQFNNDCMLAIAHMLQAPIVALSSCSLLPWHYRRMGTPFSASFQPVNFLPYTDEIDFVGRVNNFVHFHILNFLYRFVTQRNTDALIRKHFGPTIPPVESLVRNISIMLINQHFSITGAFPYTPNVIEVGGLHLQSVKPLEKSLKELLDKSSNGVVYISWGSMVRPESLPLDKRSALLNVIRKLPNYTFLMKWAEDIPDRPRNLHTRSWLPQRDVLCHPNVKAFMTHGGLLGASEAVSCGVPMLMTPLYGDQFLNSQSMAQRKLGVIMRFQHFDETNILGGLQTILKPSFLQHTQQVSKAFHSQPQSPLQLAIWWVEHVIETDGAPLAQNAMRNHNWMVYYSVDIYLTLIGVLAVFIFVLRTIFKTLSGAVSKIKRDKPKTE